MDPQLMRAPGERFQRQPGQRLALAVLPPAQHLPAGLGGQSQRIDLHPPAARRIEPAKRQIDQPFRLLRTVLDDSPIELVHLPVLEQFTQLFQSLMVSSQDQAAGRVAIEPMGERGRARQAEAQRIEIGFQIFAAFRALMHGDARRFVDHEHQTVAIKKAIIKFFRRHGEQAIEARRMAVKPVQVKRSRWTQSEGEMSDDEKKKPGFFGRLFGRDAAPEDTAVAEPTAETAGQTAKPEAKPEKKSWWQRLKQGLSRSSSALGQSIGDIFTKRKLGNDTLEELEDALIQADLGVTMAGRIAEAVGKGRYDKEIAPEEVRAIMAGEIENVLTPVAKPLEIDAGQKPFVILVVGVNGSGKTTTIGKLSGKLAAEGRKVMLAAGDTFRAAAIEQLKIWGGRIGATVVARAQGSDAASLAFEAIEQARAENADVLIMDTAGRLQNRAELMAELEKIVRVMKKVDAQAPHAVLLVLDATVGQNAMSQVEIFGQKAGVTGLVMTKLDGTARGGILVAIAEKFRLPVHFIGVGEQMDDLEPFAARDFARAIAGLDEVQDI